MEWCLLLALLVSVPVLVAGNLLGLPLWVGVAVVVAMLIVALWLGSLLDAEEWEGSDE